MVTRDVTQLWLLEYLENTSTNSKEVTHPHPHTHTCIPPPPPHTHIHTHVRISTYHFMAITLEAGNRKRMKKEGRGEVAGLRRSSIHAHGTREQKS